MLVFSELSRDSQWSGARLSHNYLRNHLKSRYQEVFILRSLNQEKRTLLWINCTSDMQRKSYLLLVGCCRKRFCIESIVISLSVSVQSSGFNISLDDGRSLLRLIVFETHYRISQARNEAFQAQEPDLISHAH